MDLFRTLSFARRGLRRSGPPLHLTLYVTGACNLRCRHCFHWKEVAASVPGPSLENVRKLADSAARMGPMLWVSFGGGEPFLREDLPELAEAFGRHGLRHLAIPTNGLVKRTVETTAEILERCPETHVSISVSIDGPPEIHDSIRQVPGGHDRSLEGMHALRELRGRFGSRLGVGFLVCVTHENQDVLGAHLESLVREHAPDNVTVNLARGTAMEGHEHLLDVDPDRYDEVVATKKRLMDEGALPYFEFPLARVAVARDRLMYDHVSRQARGDASMHLPCTAGSLSAVIFEDGAVHPCEILGKELGNLSDVDWDLERLWSTASADALRREIKDTRCACTWECAQADNVLFQPRLWPRLAVDTLRG